MKLQGQCAHGHDHTVDLAVDAEVDLDAVVQLSSSMGGTDTVQASSTLVAELIKAGVIGCSDQRREGSTLGYSNGYVTT